MHVGREKRYLQGEKVGGFMWNWFRSKIDSQQSVKSGKDSVKLSVAPDEFYGSQSSGLVVEDVYDAIKFYFYAVKPRLYYAHMQGFLELPSGLDEIADEDFLISLLEEDEAILDESEDWAFRSLMFALDSMFDKNADDKVRVYLQRHPKCELLERLGSKWPEEGVMSFVEDKKDRLKSSVRSYVSFCKLADDIELSGKLTSKYELIVPIFKAALARGVSRYGDQSYSIYYGECKAFVAEYFKHDDLRFYSPSDAWVSVSRAGIALVDL